MNQMRACVVVVVCVLVAAANAFTPAAPVALRKSNAAVSSGLMRPRRVDVLTKMSLEASAVNAAVTTAADCSILLAGNSNGTAAFMATMFGTFIPVVFLLTLFIQSEARKAAESGSEGRKF